MLFGGQWVLDHSFFFNRERLLNYVLAFSSFFFVVVVAYFVPYVVPRLLLLIWCWRSKYKALESWILRPFLGWRNCFQGHFWEIKGNITRFGPGRVWPSWINTQIWNMPNERYTYRDLRTDLIQILWNWPFENSTTVFLDHKVKSKIWIGNQKNSLNKKLSIYPLCIIKFSFRTFLRTF